MWAGRPAHIYVSSTRFVALVSGRKQYPSQAIVGPVTATANAAIDSSVVLLCRLYYMSRYNTYVHTRAEFPKGVGERERERERGGGESDQGCTHARTTYEVELRPLLIPSRNRDTLREGKLHTYVLLRTFMCECEICAKAMQTGGQPYYYYYYYYYCYYYYYFNDVLL